MSYIFVKKRKVHIIDSPLNGSASHRITNCCLTKNLSNQIQRGRRPKDLPNAENFLLDNESSFITESHVGHFSQAFHMP